MPTSRAGSAAKIAFIDPERSLTYGELQARSIRFAHALRALGIRQEERVALLLHDTVDYPVAFWGAVRAGNVAIPLNTFLHVAQYAYILADSRASALVADATLARAIWPVIERLPYLRTVILVGAGEDDNAAFPGREVHLFEDVSQREIATPFTADTVSDEVAFWLYTSGSTGDPKGVKHVHSNLMATAKLFGQGVLGIGENDVVHSAAKLFFAYGLGNAMTFPLSVGATAVLWPQRPTPDGMLAIMRRHHPSIFYGVPSLYTALLAHPDIGKGMGSDRLRLCVSAGEALPAHIGERWREVVGVDVLDGIGSTELLQTFLSNRPGDIRYGSTGKPVPGYEARIVDEKGREFGRGRDRRTDRARAVGRRRLLEPARQEPPHLRRRMGAYRRQIPPRCRRLLLLLRPHRRHVQGLWHVGVAVRRRGGADVARSRAGGRRHRQRGRRRPDQAEGLHRAQERLCRRREPVGKAEAARQGDGGRVEISALDRRVRQPAAHRDGQDPALQAARRRHATRRAGAN